MYVHLMNNKLISYVRRSRLKYSRLRVRRPKSRSPQVVNGPKTPTREECSPHFPVSVTWFIDVIKSLTSLCCAVISKRFSSHRHQERCEQDVAMCLHRQQFTCLISNSLYIVIAQCPTPVKHTLEIYRTRPPILIALKISYILIKWITRSHLNKNKSNVPSRSHLWLVIQPDWLTRYVCVLPDSDFSPFHSLIPFLLNLNKQIPTVSPVLKM